MTPEQKAERLEQIKNDPSALESYLDTADELSVALVEELTLSRKLKKEIDSLHAEIVTLKSAAPSNSITRYQIMAAQLLRVYSLKNENRRLRETLEWVRMNSGNAGDGNRIDPIMAHRENCREIDKALADNKGVSDG